MHDRNISLTAAEWNLMESLWAASPRTGREAVDDLRARVGWNRSTTLTMLRRMTEKGFVHCETQNGMKTYFPNIRREEAVIKETDDFLNRVYKGSVSMLMSALTKKQDLTKAELEELYTILQEAKEAAK